VKQTAYVDPPVLHLLDGRPYVLPRSAHAELGCNHQNTRIDPGSHQVDFAWQVTAGSPLVAGGKILWYASSLEFDATPGHIYELVVKRRLWVGYVCDLIDQTTGQTVATRGEWGSQCGDPETRVVYRRFQDAYSDVCTSRAHSQVEECIAPWFIVSRAEDQ
jgi:hypothetical protein